MFVATNNKIGEVADMEIRKVGIQILDRMSGITYRGIKRYSAEHAARLCAKRTTLFYTYKVVP